jgi:hypothetical protein
MENEIWKVLEGFEGYEVSNMGRIRFSFVRWHPVEPYIIKTFTNTGTGYSIVSLNRRNEKRITKNVHRLIATTFIENPEGYSMIDHLNEIKSDNRVENLRFMDHQSNCQRSSSNPVMLENKKTGEKLAFVGVIQAAAYLKVDYPGVWSAAQSLKKNGKRRVCKGYYVDYLNVSGKEFVDYKFEEQILKP